MEAGPGSRFKAGDRVACLQQGAFCDEVVTGDGAMTPVPEGLALDEAAALPVAFGTAHLALMERARLKPGQVVLVTGAAGGVGLAAVQIAKAVGAVVVAVARGGEKMAALRRAGADACLDSSEAGPLRARVRAALAALRAPRKGVDVFLDNVGGEQFHEGVSSCAWGAQVLVVGFASGSIPKIGTNVALVKNLTVHGIYWGSYLKHSPRVLLASLSELFQWAAEGRVKVQISHRVMLGRAHEAFGAVMRREAVGKVVLLTTGAHSRL
mmetsp:Transcript_15834/g.49759  ORF Transcript_15834/g.49759 Transcript_15834/m.49759 type:complete len:267 (-) Transcript_15834:51-851(-)